MHPTFLIGCTNYKAFIKNRDQNYILLRIHSDCMHQYEDQEFEL